MLDKKCVYGSSFSCKLSMVWSLAYSKPAQCMSALLSFTICLFNPEISESIVRRPSLHSSARWWPPAVSFTTGTGIATRDLLKVRVLLSMPTIAP